MITTPHPLVTHQAQLKRPRSLLRLAGIAGVLLPTLAGAGGCSSQEGASPPGDGAGGGDSSAGGSIGATGGSGGVSHATGGATSATGGSSAGGSSSDGGSPPVGSGGESPTGGGGATASGGTENGTGGGDSRSPGCGTPFQAPPSPSEQQTLQIEGDARYYLMDVPNDADNTEPLMLVFALHGYDMNNVAVVDLFNFTERSQGRAITVWPQGEGPHPGNVSHWGDQVLKSTWTANDKNYSFLRQIMTDLGERYCVDESRVFIAGFSMGAFFTNQMACDHPDWFRAFAPVAGGAPQSCTAQSAIMVQHGTADDIVDISSGEESRDFWLARNGCGTSTSSSLSNCQFYEGCAEDKPVAWCTGNYDHYIPGEVASNIWSFFSSFESHSGL